jgi:carbon-monoxide dehydrogenase medium subunit
MIEFELHRPSSLAEAFSLLETYGEDARVMAGGTALVLQMKQRLAQPEHVISLRGVTGLNRIEESANGPTHGWHNGTGGLRIGALCAQQQVATSPLVKEKLPLVAETYQHVARPRIRYMASVGGGLVHGDPSQDPPPSLIALGASLTLTSSGGQRVVSLEDFLIDYYETDVQPGEILTDIFIPSAPAGSGAAYLKFLPRTADDYATVAVAAVVTPGVDNRCQDVRIALGAVGTTAIHATQAEEILRGRPLTEENIRAAAASVKEVVDPLDDYRGSAGYKREMAEVFTRRAIQQALANAGSG